MGTDSRIKDREYTVDAAALQSLIESLYIALDDTSFADGGKNMLLKTLLKETSVKIADNANNYQAVTPESFYASTADETDFGITKIASDSDVASKTGTNVLTAGKITKMADVLTDFYYEALVTDVDGSSNAVVTVMNLKFIKIGKLVWVFGYFHCTPSSVIGAGSLLTIYLNNCPMNNDAFVGVSTVCVFSRSGLASTLAVGSLIKTFGKLLIALQVPAGMSLTTVNHVVNYNGFYYGE